ncbi:MAG: hypothetical protein P1V97_13040 [Planctomycetota bacterium]|nr:hypothetical protein [Planctomycetota bacterium]
MTETSIQSSLDSVLFQMSALNHALKPSILELRRVLEALGGELESFQEAGLSDPDLLDQLDLNDEVLAMEVEEIQERKRQLQDDFDALSERLAKLLRFSDCIDDLRGLWDDWEQIEQDQDQLLTSEEVID